MRKIGLLKKEQAEIFGSYLLVEGIENSIREADDGMMTVWVHAENEVETGKNLFEVYCKDPSSSVYTDVKQKAQKIKSEKKRDVKKAKKNFINVKEVWQRGSKPTRFYVTLVLIGISALVFLISRFGDDFTNLQKLFISGFTSFRLPEFWKGEVWRVVTPIFLHAGIFHFIFNMLWLLTLGSMIERIQGHLFLLLQVIAIATLSNLCQHYVSGPSFGGMSGVVYGLFGYIWMRFKFNSYSGYYLTQQNIILMILFFFICFTGVIGPIANTAHSVGLLTGVFWGLLIERKNVKRHFG